MQLYNLAMAAIDRKNENQFTMLRHELAHTPFNEAYDLFKKVAGDLGNQGRIREAESIILRLDASLGRLEQSTAVVDVRAALMQVLTSLYLRSASVDAAMQTAARVLNIMVQQPKRRDEPFLSVLAPLLHNISAIHSQRGEFKQAERDIEKSAKIYSRLVKINPERYGAAHITAVNEATQIHSSRQKQTELLSQCHQTVLQSLELANSGATEATAALADSLAEEGHTLMKMGRTRDGIDYISRALKYLTRIEPDFTLKQLELSIDLGEALLLIPNSREKAINLLNTMLHKATKLGAEESHRRVVDILLNASSRQLDILGLWHKLFPR